ncbi:hypothetical protein CERSUDRAFT_119582, partial [Gelatoporia subvermispora B]
MQWFLAYSDAPRLIRRRWLSWQVPSAEHSHERSKSLPDCYHCRTCLPTTLSISSGAIPKKSPTSMPRIDPEFTCSTCKAVFGTRGLRDGHRRMCRVTLDLQFANKLVSLYSGDTGQFICRCDTPSCKRVYK